MPLHNRNILKMFRTCTCSFSRQPMAVVPELPVQEAVSAPRVGPPGRTPYEGLVASSLLQNGSRTRRWQALHSPATLPPSRRPTGTPRLDLQCPTPWDKNVSVRLCTGTFTVSQRASRFAVGCVCGGMGSSLPTNQTRQLHLFLILFLFRSPCVHADHMFYLLESLLFLLQLENQIITRFSCPLAHRHAV